MIVRKLLHGISMESKNNSLEWQINLKTHLNNIENERNNEFLHEEDFAYIWSLVFMDIKNINCKLKNTPLLVIAYKDTHEIEIMDLAYANNKTRHL